MFIQEGKADCSQGQKHFADCTHWRLQKTGTGKVLVATRLSRAGHRAELHCPGEGIKKSRTLKQWVPSVHWALILQEGSRAASSQLPAQPGEGETPAQPGDAVTRLPELGLCQTLLSWRKDLRGAGGTAHFSGLQL